MNGATAGARRGVSIIEPRTEDRWIGMPMREASLAMSGIVAVSLLIHTGILFFAATFVDRTPSTPPSETVVELVQEPAKTPPEAAKASEKGQTEGGDTHAAPADKASTPKPEAAEMPQADLQPAPLKSEPEAGKTSSEAAGTRAGEHAEDARGGEKEAVLDSLKQELESLKVQQKSLKADAEAAAAAEKQAVDATMYTMGAKGYTMGTTGIGAIPSSFGAIQLPQLSDTEGEATGYEQIVFSQLARTKGVRRHIGMIGTAGIVFTIDAAGKLGNAIIAHPSGSAALDEEAMQIVTASAPFPKPPDGATRTISANFNFVPQPEP